MSEEEEGCVGCSSACMRAKYKGSYCVGTWGQQVRPVQYEVLRNLLRNSYLSQSFFGLGPGVQYV